MSNDNIPNLSIGTQLFLTEFYFACLGGLNTEKARDEAGRWLTRLERSQMAKEAGYFQIAARALRSDTATIEANKVHSRDGSDRSGA